MSEPTEPSSHAVTYTPIVQILSLRRHTSIYIERPLFSFPVVSPAMQPCVALNRTIPNLSTELFLRDCPANLALMIYRYCPTEFILKRPLKDMPTRFNDRHRP